MATEIVLMPDADGSGDVIEFCVEIGDKIVAGDSIIVIESDKASMEVPSSIEGTVVEWLVEMGDGIEKGRPLAKVEISEDVIAEVETLVAEQSADTASPRAVSAAPSAASEKLVLMPDAGGKGDLIEFFVQPGDSFLEGDMLLLVESDKAAMEIPAPFSGSVIELVAELGQTVEEGAILIKALGAVESNSVEGTAALSVTQSDSKTSEPLSTPKTLASSSTVAAASIAAVSSILNTSLSAVGTSQVYAGPATRKLARELGVDLAKVKGAGKRARILKEDVKQFVKQQMSTANSANVVVQSGVPAIPSIDFSKFGEIDTQNLSGIAKATSAHMTRCWLNIPHVTLFDEVDITDLDAFRAAINPELYGLLKKPTILPFIIMIVAKALRKHPQFNASLHADGEQIIYKDYVHIGVAVDTPAGLVVPVIRDADKKSVSELTLEIAELAKKANDRKLKIDDMQGGCFTVSSLGASGGVGFTPIINGPEVAILGVARADIKPSWDGEAFIPRKQLPLCLSFDHRVVNGADAGRFMAMIHQCLSKIGNTLL
ncbi:2-oxo acid dehydrogenase subunit E2 [Neptunomonas sp.]|uniref:2-oxo acid dehydrogenase subunit E2 n=1 Tax=Neptunomonas sp. TaxID=1971898 RepID=UPI0025D2902C|nr:2-oxo acid dehydrogenase subunit E2 [Neptunomonas sp.]